MYRQAPPPPDRLPTLCSASRNPCPAARPQENADLLRDGIWPGIPSPRMTMERLNRAIEQVRFPESRIGAAIVVDPVRRRITSRASRCRRT